MISGKESSMGVWILTQDKKNLLLVSEIKQAGAKITGYSQRRPMGILLGRYRDENSSGSVLQRIIATIEGSPAENVLFQMPGRNGF
jgi:hypothetical protein